ncbi:MAG: S-layer homology domain-containing protein [Anaerovoracaceae bacterium]|nr:S-layer homology domain-containing protein [Anaerovoracaceae bacterium]
MKKENGVLKVTLTAASGYNLTNDGNDKYTVSPRHSSSGSSTTTYTVTVGSVSNGTVTSSHKSAASGATVTLTVKPADGYAVEAVTAKDAKGNAVKVTEKDGKYTFAMPASNVTVSASFVKKGDQPAAKLFDDVAQGAYYYDAVKWAVDKGVTNGKISNLFGSDDPCTRAQIVTFLWRAAGSPAASASVSFTDVKDSDYYAKAVAWAVEKGITNGTGDGKFSSDDTCTRAQCAAFLYRAAGLPEVTDAAAFSDVAADAYYAQAVAWAEKNGITNGLGNGKFGSDNSCTRAQIITFLYRTYQGK